MHIYCLRVLLALFDDDLVLHSCHSGMFYFSAFIRVGGFTEMVEKYPDALSSTYRNMSQYSNNTCGKPRDDYMHLFRHPGTLSASR